MCNRCGMVLPRPLLRGHLDIHRHNPYNAQQMANSMPSYSAKMPFMPTGPYHMVPPPNTYVQPSLQKSDKRRARDLARSVKRSKLFSEKEPINDPSNTVNSDTVTDFTQDQPKSEISDTPTIIKNPYNDFCPDHSSASQCYRTDCITMQQYISQICDWRIKLCKITK